MIKVPPISVLIADDHPLFRDGVKTLLEEDNSIQVIGEACNGRELINFAKLLKPDIVVTDLYMPEINGVDAIRQIVDLDVGIKCIAVSNFDTDALIMEALEAGASGFIIKNAQPGEMLEAIRMVHQGGSYYCKTTAAKFFRNISRSKYNKSIKAYYDLFSEREKEIIKLICQEQTTDEIARQLFMSPRTVEGCRARILRKMNVRSSIGVLIYALRNGLYILLE